MTHGGPLLAVDTSASKSGVALVAATAAAPGAAASAAVLAASYLEPGRCRGEELADCVRGILDQTETRIEDLAALAVSRGPGSFTGVRVGLALIRGLALVDDLPVVGLGSLELVALAARAPAGRLCTLIEAGRDKVYAAGYERTEQALDELFEGTVVRDDELGAMLESQRGRDSEHENEQWTLCGEAALLARLRSALPVVGGISPGAPEANSVSVFARGSGSARHEYVEVSDERAGTLGVAGHALLAAGEAVSAQAVMPLYVAATGARPNVNKVAARFRPS